MLCGVVDQRLWGLAGSVWPFTVCQSSADTSAIKGEMAAVLGMQTHFCGLE